MIVFSSRYGYHNASLPFLKRFEINFLNTIGISLFEVCVALFIVSVAIFPLCDRMEASLLETVKQKNDIASIYARI
jgi:hypothetical protein